MERYDDVLATCSDVEIEQLLSEELSSIPSTTPSVESFHHLYRYDRYEWRGFKTDCAVVPLTKGYFTFVEHKDLKKMEVLSSVWTNVALDASSGEIVKVRAWCQFKCGGKHVKMSLHRFLMDARGHDFIDHYNHHTLDNRSERNLIKTNQAANLAHARRIGTSGLKRGVYHPNGDPLKFRGRISYKGTQYESPSYDNEDDAHKWYLTKHKELYGYTNNEGEPRLRDYPKFPPLKRTSIVLPSMAGVRGPYTPIFASGSQPSEEIPF